MPVPIDDGPGGTRRPPRGAATRVQRAGADRHLYVALQPIVSLSSGRLVGAEALCRFPDMRPPKLRFAEADRAGLGPALQLAAASAALDAGHVLAAPSFVAVNLSTAVLLGPALPGVLDASRVPPDRVVFELGDTEAITLAPGLTRALGPLRERGVRLAVDASNATDDAFSQLLSLRPEVIKFGRTAVAEFATDPARRAFLVATNLLALEMGAAVAATGIEQPAELEAVRAVGVSYGQGYLLGHPTTDAATWRSWESRHWSLLSPGAPRRASGGGPGV